MGGGLERLLGKPIHVLREATIEFFLIEIYSKQNTHFSNKSKLLPKKVDRFVC